MKNHFCIFAAAGAGLRLAAIGASILPVDWNQSKFIDPFPAGSVKFARLKVTGP